MLVLYRRGGRGGGTGLDASRRAGRHWCPVRSDVPLNRGRTGCSRDGAGGGPVRRGSAGRGPGARRRERRERGERIHRGGGGGGRVDRREEPGGRCPGPNQTGVRESGSGGVGEAGTGAWSGLGSGRGRQVRHFEGWLRLVGDRRFAGVGSSLAFGAPTLLDRGRIGVLDGPGGSRRGGFERGFGRGDARVGGRGWGGVDDDQRILAATARSRAGPPARGAGGGGGNERGELDRQLGFERRDVRRDLIGVLPVIVQGDLDGRRAGGREEVAWLVSTAVGELGEKVVDDLAIGTRIVARIRVKGQFVGIEQNAGLVLELDEQTGAEGLRSDSGRVMPTDPQAIRVGWGALVGADQPAVVGARHRRHRRRVPIDS